ncbi:hypothetical protein [uncultured Microscilla sp.]|uniref:hypothetical protein n=1 Tax=uncultured Microscilla sp. TaxID=432653 RepID=UPI00261F6D40|nr:hypothetical protein [uncultured Microscilla sp.]
MTPTEAAGLIAQHKPEWYAHFEQEKSAKTYYLLMSDIGHEIVDDAVEHQNIERIYKVFHTIENILEQINFKDHIDASSLIGAGMFEAMHSTAMVPRDFLNQFMGTRTLKFWQGIIEGWRGKGIRTLSMCERVITYGLSRVEIDWQQRAEKLLVDNLQDTHHPLRMHWQGGSLLQEEVISPKRSKQALRFFSPLIAEQALGYRPKIAQKITGFDTPYAVIKTTTASLYKLDIIVGNPVGEIIPQRYARTSKGACYTLNTAWEEILNV